MGDLRVANPGANPSSLSDAQSDLAVKRLRNKALQNPGLDNRASRDTSSKIDKAAHDFESILVGQWLEKAEKSFATVPGSDPDQSQDSSHDQFESISCQFMGQALTKNGSFGIATMISKSLRAAAANQTSDNTVKETSGSSAQVTMGAPKLNNYR